MKAVVLVSGGLDSATCLALAVGLHGSENVEALSMYYGQRHQRELNAAYDVCCHYDVQQVRQDISSLFQASNCPLLKHSSEELIYASYEDQLNGLGGHGIVSTYVPFRNGLFLSAATSLAISLEAGVIYYGAHRDDAVGGAYPDCTPEFVKAMCSAIKEGSGGLCSLNAPFINMTKAEIVEMGLMLKVPYELTWSCYEGGDKPCGRCGTCLDRAAAFAASNVPDPALK